MTKDPNKLADLLRSLQGCLEDDGLSKTGDFILARRPEDQLGSGQNISEDAVASAQSLLRSYGFE